MGKAEYLHCQALRKAGTSVPVRWDPSTRDPPHVRGQGGPTPVGTRRSPRLLHRFTGNNVALLTLAIGATAPTAFEQPGPFVHFEDVTRDGRYLVFKSLKAPDEIWIQRVGDSDNDRSK